MYNLCYRTGVPFSASTQGLQIRLCPEASLEPIISQVRSPVPFSRVSYIYDHLAHSGNPLTSTRIAPTHAFL